MLIAIPRGDDIQNHGRREAPRRKVPAKIGTVRPGGGQQGAGLELTARRVTKNCGNGCRALHAVGSASSAHTTPGLGTGSGFIVMTLRGSLTPERFSRTIAGREASRGTVAASISLTRWHRGATRGHQRWVFCEWHDGANPDSFVIHAPLQSGKTTSVAVDVYDHDPDPR